MRKSSTSRFDGNRSVYGAHWTIFLPSLAVFLLYGGAWLALAAAGKGNTALAKISLLVILIIVPVLAVRACLRFMSLGLMIGQDSILYRQGWLRPRWRRVRANELSHVSAIRSPVGRMLGGGSVTFSRTDGSTIHLYDLADPEAIARRVMSLRESAED